MTTMSTPPDTVTEPSAGRRGRRKNTPGLKRALIVMGCGLALIGIGAAPLAGEVTEAAANSPSVQGAVVDVRFKEPVEDKEDAPLSCTPVAGYEVDGMNYNASSDDFSTDCNWTIGQEIKVAYTAANPVDARITTAEFDQMTLALPASGAAVAAGGLLMILAARRKAKLS